MEVVNQETVSSEDNDASEEALVDTNVVPDGGWGWIVVFSAFFFNFLTDGCAYSFGVLFTHLVDYFGATRSQTAWIGSVFNSAPLLCGPIASFLTNKYGYRKSAVAGGVVTVIGFFASVFAPSVEVLCITYGVIAGFGISLPYLVSSVIVAVYFRRKLSFASGLAECGAGVGTLVFAPLLERLIHEYGWRGAILILSGIVGNVIVCGAVYKPLNSKPFKGKEDSVSSSLDKCIPVKVLIEDCKGVVELFERDQYRQNGDINTHAVSYQDSQVCAESEMITSEENVEDATERTAIKLPAVDVPGTTVKITNTSDIKTSIVFSSNDLKEKYCPLLCQNSCFDTSVLFNVRYLLFALSNFILYFWYDVPYVFTVDRAKELGENDYNAAFLVSVIGILHTIGNIVCGYVGDRQSVNRSCFYSLSMWICGASLAIVPLFRDLIPSGFCLGTYGLFSAATEALRTAILVDIVGVDKLTNAFGLLMCLQGLANLIGPPVAGWLFDMSGSYNHTFLTSGICIVISGILSMISAFLPRCRHAKHNVSVLNDDL